MKTIIAGSRNISDYNVVERLIEASRLRFFITEVVSGRAPGVDRHGERWANYKRIPVKPFPAAWRDRDGVVDYNAGKKRNQQMADYADALIAIWDGQSSGTRDMIERALMQGLEVDIQRYEH